MLVGLALVTVGGRPSHPRHLVDPAFLGAVAMLVALMQFASAMLLRSALGRTRSLLDHLGFMVLLGASFSDLVVSAAPMLIGHETIHFGAGVRAAASLLIALAFALTAWSPRGGFGWRPAHPARIGAGIVVGALIVGEGVDLVAQSQGAMSPFATDAGATMVAIVSATLLIAAGIGLGWRTASFGRGNGALAMSAFALAGVRLQAAFAPMVPVNWLTTAEALQVVAYGLLLLVAMEAYRLMQARVAEAQVEAERLRIAQDLHDGLAQDLAFIAIHGDRLATEHGEQHPLAIAARRALEASRGAIVDLSESGAPSTLQALRRTAEEVESRYEVEITVSRIDREWGLEAELDADDRNEVVRIAREAMVNSVRHGRARHVSVELGSKTSGGVLLRVSDDGCGLGEESAASTAGVGLGLPTMRLRARRVGGWLSAQRGGEGGTEIELRT